MKLTYLYIDDLNVVLVSQVPKSISKSIMCDVYSIWKSVAVGQGLKGLLRAQEKLLKDAESIGVAAVKYFDLRQNRNSDYRCPNGTSSLLIAYFRCFKR